MMPNRSVNGKKLTVLLFLGLVVFTVVMSFGTYGLGEWMKHLFPKEETAEAQAIQQIQEREGRAPSNPGP